MTEQLDEYFNLKTEYEKAHKKELKKRVKDPTREIKYKCLLCDSNKPMTFIQDKRTFTAKCESSKCKPMVIVLKKYFNFDDYLEHINKKINNDMISLTKDKLNTFYRIPAKSNIKKIIERVQTEQAWKATLETSLDESSERFKLDEEEEKIKREKASYVDEIREFVKEGDFKSAVSIYKEHIIPMRERYYKLYNQELEWDKKDEVAVYTHTRRDKLYINREFME